MKLYYLIAPVAALLGSSYWLYSQNGTIQELTEKTRVIRERIVIVDQATSSSPVVLGPAPDEKTDEFTLPDGSLDWKMIAELMTEARASNGMPNNMKAMLKLQTRLMEMTEDEITDGLEKITGFDLDPKALDMLKQGLLGRLVEKNPIAALEAFGDPVTSQSDSLFWTQSQIISKVAKQDPAIAIAWIDKHIAAGNLESTSLNSHQDPRIRVEGALISQLISSDYDTARKRLEVFTEKQKVRLLSNSSNFTASEISENHLKLAREVLPPDLASDAIISAYGNQYHESLEKIGESLEKYNFTEEERAGVVERLVNNFANNDQSEKRYQEIYEWSKTTAPGQESDLVASALNNNHGRWNEPEKTFREALSVAEATGDPDVIVKFVSKFSDEGREETVTQQISKFKNQELIEKYRALVEDLPKPDSK